MKIYITLIFALVFACGAKEKKTKEVPMSAQAHAKGQLYCAQLTDAVFKERCDKITFKALVSVNCLQDLSAFENKGKWERDDKQCYPSFSKSSISRDGLISVLHYIWTKRDHDMLKRLIAYGEERSWVVGEGPLEYTDAIILTPIIYYMNAKMINKGDLADDLLPTTEDIATSFKGHLLASYIWLAARVNGGYIDYPAKVFIGKMYAAAPSDPMYAAMQHRFLDGNQTETFYILLNDPTFTVNEFPTDTGAFGWGSAPVSVYYLMSLAIAEGL